MTTVQSTSGSTQTTAATSSSSSASGTADVQNRFIQLLVAQMQNQDPLNPLDNAQVTSQLAQISTVNGLEQLNSAFSAFADSMKANQSMQAAALIGHRVLTDGNGLELSGGEAKGGVNLAGDADSVKVDILDSSGNVVDSVSFGAQTAGNITFSWDGAGGTQPDGNYTIQVSATKDGKPVDATAMTAAKVESVTLTNGEATLNLSNSTTLALANVQEIL